MYRIFGSEHSQGEEVCLDLKQKVGRVETGGHDLGEGKCKELVTGGH
mgnify:CR=1 FL=1